MPPGMTAGCGRLVARSRPLVTGKPDLRAAPRQADKADEAVSANLPAIPRIGRRNHEDFLHPREHDRPQLHRMVPRKAPRSIRGFSAQFRRQRRRRISRLAPSSGLFELTSGRSRHKNTDALFPSSSYHLPSPFAPFRFLPLLFFLILDSKPPFPLRCTPGMPFVDFSVP